MRYPHVAHEIDAWAKVDQDIRFGALSGRGWDLPVDEASTEWMQEVVLKIGWPTISKVGKKAAGHAWLLVQHADRAVAFQEECLALMRAEPAEEVERQQIAMLTDRVCVNRKRPQVYGTQFRPKDGKHVPLPIEDEAHVDERRISMGLGTLAEGTARMYEKYGWPK